MSNNKIEPSTIFILAGPNGAGKTTFANCFLPEFVSCREFLNADLIAAGLSPYSPESQVIRASELMLTRIYQLVAAQESFAFETTFGKMDDNVLIDGERAMNIEKMSQEEQSLSAKADAAFRKASHDVIKKAEQSGTEVVIWRDNTIVKLSPEEAALPPLA